MTICQLHMKHKHRDWKLDAVSESGDKRTVNPVKSVPTQLSPLRAKSLGAMRLQSTQRSTSVQTTFSSLFQWILVDSERLAYSFLRADFRFSSLSSWAASRSFTSEPGILAGMISSWRLLLCGIREPMNSVNEISKEGVRKKTMICSGCTRPFTDLLESEEIPRAFSKEVLYFSIRREKSLYRLSTAVTHFFISAAWACPFSQKPSASCINSFTLSLVCCKTQRESIVRQMNPTARNLKHSGDLPPTPSSEQENRLVAETETKAPSPATPSPGFLTSYLSSALPQWMAFLWPQRRNLDYFSAMSSSRRCSVKTRRMNAWRNVREARSLHHAATLLKAAEQRHSSLCARLLLVPNWTHGSFGASSHSTFWFPWSVCGQGCPQSRHSTKFLMKLLCIMLIAFLTLRKCGGKFTSQETIYMEVL